MENGNACFVNHGTILGGDIAVDSVHFTMSCKSQGHYEFFLMFCKS